MDGRTSQRDSLNTTQNRNELSDFQRILRTIIILTITRKRLLIRALSERLATGGVANFARTKPHTLAPRDSRVRGARCGRSESDAEGSDALSATRDHQKKDYLVRGEFFLGGAWALRA